MSDEREALYNAWWNTSSGRVSQIHGIANSRGWHRFSEVYDEPKNRNRRITEIARASDFMISQTLVKMRSLAKIALGESSDFRFSDHCNLDESSAGKLLAVQFLELFTPNKREELLSCVKMAAEQHKRENENCKLNQSNVSDILFAFVQFIEREKRLPDKQELNIEAMRIHEQLAEKNPRWNDGRWDAKEASEIRTKAGLQGLPKARSR